MIKQLISAAQNKNKRRLRETEEIEETNEDGSNEATEDEEAVEEEEVEFQTGTSQRGQPVLWFEGFRFLRAQKCGDKMLWRCENSRLTGTRKIKCPVRAVTTLEDFTRGHINPSKEANEHTHLPFIQGFEAEHRLANFKQRVVTELDVPTPALISQAKSPGISDEVFVVLPTEEAMRHHAAKKRRECGMALNTMNLAEIEVPERFAFKNGQPFLIHDTEDEDRLMVFASHEALAYLKQHLHWSADATFSMCPRVYGRTGQVFVLGFFIQHKMYPAVHALMPKRDKRHYMELLNVIKEAIGEECSPISVMTDFERAEFTAFRDIFEGIEIQGCLFHLAQAFFNRIQEIGLVKRYKEEAVSKAFRRCISLAFLPPANVRGGFALIVDQAPGGMEDFFYYLARNYIGRSRWEFEAKENAFGPNANQQRMLEELAMASPQHQPPAHSTPNGSDNSIQIRSLLSQSTIRRSTTGNSLVSHSTIRRSTTEDDSDQSFRQGSEVPNAAAEVQSAQVLSRHELDLFRPPTFEIQHWNVSNRVADELPRCQAAMESTNLSFQKQDGKHRPRMSEFLSALHKFDTTKMRQAREATLNPGAISRRREFVNMDRTIQHIVRTVQLNSDQEICLFMDGISLALHPLEAHLEQPSQNDPIEMEENNLEGTIELSASDITENIPPNPPNPNVNESNQNIPSTSQPSTSSNSYPSISHYSSSEHSYCFPR